MNGIFVYLPTALAPDQVAAILQANGIAIAQAPPEGPGLAEVGADRDHVWFFDERDPAEIPEALGDLLQTNAEGGVLVLEYSSIDAVKRVGAVLAHQPGARIDTDHGETMAGSEFLKRVDEDPLWDWRRRT
jgi:hypothetical protein